MPDNDSYFDSFLNELITANLQSQGKLSVVEFAHRILFNNDPNFKLYPTQTAILKAFYKEELNEEEASILNDWIDNDRSTWVKDRKYISLILEAGRRASKFLEITTLINTSKGYKQLKDIHIGDEVFSFDGTLTKVINETIIQTNKKCYKLYFSDNSEIICSDDHLWRTWDKAARKAYSRSKNPSKHPQVRTTQEIVDSLYVERLDNKIENNHSIELAKSLELPERDLGVHTYCYGYFLGDGHYKSGTITSSEEDIDWLRNKFHSLGYDTELAPTKGYPFRFKSRKLNKELQKLGLYNDKSKSVPEYFLLGSIQQRLALLQGLMDSDGTVDKKGKAYFTNTNKNLTDLVFRLAASLGCVPKRTYHTGSYKNNEGVKIICKNFVRVSLRPKLTPVSLPRKVERYKPCTCQNDKRFILKIEEVPSVPVKCIEVEHSSHMFLVGEALIPTHNCNSESAYITTTEGDITYGKLHELLSKNIKVGIYTYDISKPIIDKYITYNLKSELNAIEQTYEIKTETGKTEIVNENHPFLIWKDDKKEPEWLPLKDIKVNNWLATSSNLPLFGKKSYEKDYLALCAFLLTIKASKDTHQLNKYKITDYVEQVDKSFINRTIGESSISFKMKYCYLKRKATKLKKAINKEFIGSLDKDCLLTFLRYICMFSYQEKHKGLSIKKEDSFCVIFYTNEFTDFITRQFLKFGFELYYLDEYIYLNSNSKISEFIKVFGWDIATNRDLRTEFVRYENNVNEYKDIKLPYGSKLLLDKIVPNTLLNKHTLRNEGLETNDEYLHDLLTNEITWEKVESITPHKIEQTIALEVEGTNVIGNNIISHNSTLASIICLKEFYDLIILENPHHHYPSLGNTPIAILVMAQSQAQVKETIFAAIRGYAQNSEFFTLLEKRGEIEILKEEIRHTTKNISIFAKHTNSKSLVGYTLKCMILDEVARFESIGPEGKNKAFEIWRNVACHKSDNLIYVKNGAITFQNLLNSKNHIPILTYDLKSGKQFYTKQYEVFDNGIQHTFKVTTKSGRVTEVTSEHPFLVWRKEWTEFKWIPAIKLRPTDAVAISAHNLTHKTKPLYHPSLSKLLGYLISEDNIISNFKSPVLKFVSENSHILQDFKYHLYKWNPDFFIINYKDYKNPRIKNNNLISWLKEIGTLNDTNYLIKDIPDYLFIASKEEVSNFISALFNIDSFTPNLKTKARAFIEYVSHSLRFIQRLQELLLRFGILSNINTKRINDGNTKKVVYLLTIRQPEALGRFLRNIKLIPYRQKHLQSKFDDPINNQNLMIGIHSDFFVNLPSGIKQYIVSLGYNKPLYYGAGFCGKSLAKENLPIEKAKTFNLSELDKWLTGDILWDKVTSIDYVGECSTIGLTVKNTEIIGNSFITHNTGGAAFGTSFKKVAISSAWEPNDPIEQFYNQALSDPTALGFKLTTFQVNLQLKKGVTPVIVSDYIQDYTRARREYEGIRFSKHNAFIDLNNLKKAATGISVIDAQPSEIELSSEAGVRYYAGVDVIRMAENPDKSNVSFIHVDPALKKDSAALAIARSENHGNTWKIHVDALLKWEPRTNDKGRQLIVSFKDIESKIDSICASRAVKQVTFDSWSSGGFIQNLHAKGINAHQVSCTRESQFSYYTLFRDLLNHDYLVLPKDSTWTAEAITELSELVLKSNRQITHPRAGKDLADAIVNAVYQCHQYMVMSGVNMKFGLKTNLIPSQNLSSINKINDKNNKSNLIVGDAIRRLHKYQDRY